jgi:hypothetical protein
MPINLNDAGEQREFGACMPDGTFVYVQGDIRPGGATVPGSDPDDAGLFLQSKSSDAMMLDWEFTVLNGPHARQKFWQMMTVFGGSLDDHGHSKAGDISKRTLRGMMESACGISPKDNTPAAAQKRMIPSFKSMDKIPFVCRVEIVVNEGYADKNGIALVLTPDDPEYAPVKAGQDVPPKPRSGSSTRTSPPPPKSGQTTFLPPDSQQQQPSPAPPPVAAPAFVPAGPAEAAAQPGSAVPPAGDRPAWAT